MKILTFDIEEWFAYEGFPYEKKELYLPRLNILLNTLLDDLDKYNLKATFFCLGTIARDYPNVITKINNRGHEIACHSDKHYWLTELSYEGISQDTRMAVDSLEQVIGKKIKGYRAPAFSITENNKWVFEILAANGIEYDSSIYPSNRDFGGFPSFRSQEPSFVNYNGIKIKEYPMSLANILKLELAYSGGGYFRLLPYSIIKKETQKHDYVMTYFHLRDFDVNQIKKFQLSLRYIKSYYGITNAYKKLITYINDYRFINVEQASKELDWDQRPIINI